MTRAAYCFDLLPPDDPLFLRQSVCQTSPTGGMMISVNRYADQVLVMQSLNGTDSSTLELTAALAFAVAMELLAAAAVGNPSWPLINRAPVSPASGTPERQSHTDGPSTPAPSGGHPNYFPDDVMAMAREARVTRALRSSEARLAAALSPTHAPASGATERQSHTDGQSAPAPSGGHYAMSNTEVRMMLDYRGCSAEVQSVISAMADAAANGKGTA